MVLHILIIENEERRCLNDPEDALHFDDKTLIKVITDCHATGTGLRSQHYWDQQKRQGALPVVVQVTALLT